MFYPHRAWLVCGTSILCQDHKHWGRTRGSQALSLVNCLPHCWEYLWGGYGLTAQAAELWSHRHSGQLALVGSVDSCEHTGSWQLLPGFRKASTLKMKLPTGVRPLGWRVVVLFGTFWDCRTQQVLLFFQLHLTLSICIFFLSKA